MLLGRFHRAFSKVSFFEARSQPIRSMYQTDIKRFTNCDSFRVPRPKQQTTNNKTTNNKQQTTNNKQATVKVSLRLSLAGVMGCFSRGTNFARNPETGRLAAPIRNRQTNIRNRSGRFFKSSLPWYWVGLSQTPCSSMTAHIRSTCSIASRNSQLGDGSVSKFEIENHFCCHGKKLPYYAHLRHRTIAHLRHRTIAHLRHRTIAPLPFSCGLAI